MYLTYFIIVCLDFHLQNKVTLAFFPPLVFVFSVLYIRMIKYFVHSILFVHCATVLCISFVESHGVMSWITKTGKEIKIVGQFKGVRA